MKKLISSELSVRHCMNVDMYPMPYILIKLLVSTYVVCERLSVMHKQVSGWTVNFCPNFPESPFSGIADQKAPPPPFGKLQIWDDQSLLRNTPPPHFRKLQIWDDQSLLWNPPPHFGKLQIWDDQSLLRNTPPPFWKIREIVCGD